MKQCNKTMRKALAPFLLVLVISASLFFTSCNHNGSSTTTTTTSDSTVANTAGHEKKSDNVSPFVTYTTQAVIKDEWTGTVTTEPGDSEWYSSLTNSYTSVSNGSGQCTAIKDTGYTTGTYVVMEATANGEICGKVFNQALTNINTDTKLISPTFTITALTTNIPLQITVTDMTGAARVGYSVQVQHNGTNYGSAATTNSNGVANYGTNLLANTTYTVVATASGMNTSPTVTVSTTPLPGSGGSGATGKSFSGIAVYVRY